MLKQTPSQTVGPFFSFGLLVDDETNLTTDQTSGQRILIRGQVIDGDGSPITDALVEIWQADAQGIFNHLEDPRHAQADRHFRGFGRCGTASKDCQFMFKTVKPGPVVWQGDQYQAPHVNLRVFARGMLTHLNTRLYFSDEPANEHDPVLNSIEPGRRSTLIAVREDSEDLPTYRFDIHLQGENETVFFEP